MVDGKKGTSNRNLKDERAVSCETVREIILEYFTTHFTKCMVTACDVIEYRQ